MKNKYFKFLFHPIKLVKSLALLTILSIFFVPVQSQADTKLINDVVSVEYIHGWKDANGDIQGAIQFELSPGWKTYWRNPGPFGVKPNFDWTKSWNIKNIEFAWPTPEIFNQYDVKIIGYKDYVTIPIKIIKFNSLARVILRMKIAFGVCSDICLLKTAELSIPKDLKELPKNYNLIKDTLRMVPTVATDRVVSHYKCIIQINGEDVTLSYVAELSNKPISEKTMILEYSAPRLYLDNQKITAKKKTVSVTASLTNISKTMGAIERNKIVATLIIDGKGFELRGCS